MTQEQRTAESLRLLLQAAIELFAEQGYEHTTAEQIADRAGYSRSMVNARYGSKEGILETMLATEWEGHLLAVAAAEGPGLFRILGVVDALRGFVEHAPTHLRAFIVVSFEAAGPMTGLRSHVQDRLRRIESAFADAIAAGLRDGSIRHDLDPKREASDILHSGIGAAYHWIIDGEMFNFPAHLRAWREQLEQRLAAPAN